MGVDTAQYHLYTPYYAVSHVQESWGGNLAGDNSANRLGEWCGAGKSARYFQIQVPTFTHISHRDWTKRGCCLLSGGSQILFLLSLSGSLWATITAKALDGLQMWEQGDLQ